MHYETVEPDTWAVVAGRGADTAGSPLNVPPVLASNFVLGGDRVYTRNDGTPTWEAFEELLGGLEHGVAVAFASGMAAAAAIFDLLPAGAEVVLPDDCYQAVVGLAAAGQDLGRWSFTRLAPDDTDGWLQAAGLADLIWLESPSNPLLHVADLPAILTHPRRLGAIAVIDNTFATPLGQQPLELGADLALHSATKYLGGHSDLMLGVAVAREDKLAQRLRERRLLAGGIPGALETYLAVRGMRTLHVRLERATAMAHELATRLERHSDVSVVRYPGLPKHPTHPVARRFMRSYGAMISFDVPATRRVRTPSAKACRSSGTPPVSAPSNPRSNVAPPSPAKSTCHPRCCGSASAARTSKTSGPTSTAASSEAGPRHIGEPSVSISHKRHLENHVRPACDLAGPRSSPTAETTRKTPANPRVSRPRVTPSLPAIQH